MPRHGGILRRRRRWILLAGAYLVLLIASRASSLPTSASLVPSSRRPRCRRFAATSSSRSPFVWRAVAGPQEADMPDRSFPIDLLHGSPGSHRDFDRLAAARAARLHALAPVSPLRRSSRRVPDHPPPAHARYVVEEWLDQPGIERVHLLGFTGRRRGTRDLSQAPERVAPSCWSRRSACRRWSCSATMGSILMHGFQLSRLWLLTERPHTSARSLTFLSTCPRAQLLRHRSAATARVLSAIEAPV